MSSFNVFVVLGAFGLLMILAGWLMELNWVISVGALVLLGTELVFGIILAHDGMMLLPLVLVALVATVYLWNYSTRKVNRVRPKHTGRSETK